MLRSLSRRELIRKLHRFGLSGPFSGGKNHYMLHGKLKVFLPNPHRSDIGSKIVKRIIIDIGISEENFENL